MGYKRPDSLLTGRRSVQRGMHAGRRVAHVLKLDQCVPINPINWVPIWVALQLDKHTDLRYALFVTRLAGTLDPRKNVPAFQPPTGHV